MSETPEPVGAGAASDSNPPVTETTTLTTDERVSKQRGRRLAAWVLLVLAVVLAPLAATAVWAKNQVTDTDRYLATVGPLAHDPDVQAYVAAQLGDALTEALDVEEFLRGILPQALQPLARPVAAAVGSAINRAAVQLTQSDAFVDIWEDANRVAHRTISAVLTGDKPPALDESNGQLVLDLNTAAKTIQTQLVENGYEFLERFSLDRVQGQIVLIDGKGLDAIKQARSAVGLLETLAWVLPVLMIGCLVASILVCPDRRKGILRAGIGLMIGMLLVGVGVAIAQNVVIDSVDASVVPTAVTQSLFDALTLYLRRGFRLLFAVGAVLALIGAVLLLSRGDDGQPTATARWIAAARVPLYVAIAILGLVWLVVLDDVPTFALILVVVLVLLLEGAVALVASAVDKAGPKSAAPATTTAAAP